jgi:hypothetical protein
LAYFVEDIDQRIHIIGAKASAEIAGGGRIGNAASAESVEVDLILAAQLDVLQASAVTQGVVGEVEHVIGVVVRHREFEEVQVLVDRVDETDALRQQVEGADATMRQATGAVSELVVDVGGGEHGPLGIAEPFLVESAFDSALAVGQLLVYLGVHSKSLSAGGDGCSLQHQTPQKHQGFRVFSISCLAETRRVRLIEV